MGKPYNWGEDQKKMSKKNKIYVILLVFNIAVILGNILGQYAKQQEDIIISGAIQPEVSDNSDDKNHINIKTEPLEKGVYDVSIEYETDRKDVYVFMSSEKMGKSVIYADDFLLNPNKETLATQLWVNRATDTFEISISYGDDQKGKVTIDSIAIRRNTPGSCTYGVLKVLVVLICIDFFVYLFLEKEKLKKHSWILIGIICIVLVSSLGLLNEGWRRRDDTVFHMARIWGLACGIGNGNFPVKVQPEWANGYGFAVSIFYGDVFLYFPALLVLLKVPLYIAYKTYIITINTGTAILSYFSFKNISRNRKIGLICSTIYTLSIYRLCDIYYRDAVGEYTAIMFFPLIIMGVWNILFEDVKESKYKNNWIYLSIGMAGIIQSHVLSCEMIAIFLIVICMFAIKRIFNEKRYWEFMKAAVGTLCLSLNFLIPFLQYSGEDLIVFIKQPFYRIQQYGISISEMLWVWGAGAGISEYEEVTAMAISVGLPTALAILTCIYLLYNKKNFINKTIIQCVLVLLLVSLWMSTDFFPYNYLEEIAGLKMLVGSLQFPFRFMSIAMSFSTLLVCLLGMEYKENLKKKQLVGIMIGLCVISACQGMQYIQHVEEHKTLGFGKYDGAEWTADYETLSGGQYLYRDTDYKGASGKKQEIEGNAVVTDYKRTGLEYEIICHTDQESMVKLPMFYYPDYKCWDLDTKTAFQTVKGDNNELWIELPANYEGTIKVKFVEPKLWRIAEIFSLLAVGGYCILFVGIFKKEKVNSCL